MPSLRPAETRPAVDGLAAVAGLLPAALRQIAQRPLVKARLWWCGSRGRVRRFGRPVLAVCQPRGHFRRGRDQQPCGIAIHRRESTGDFQFPGRRVPVTAHHVQHAQQKAAVRIGPVRADEHFQGPDLMGVRPRIAVVLIKAPL